jgi:predicted RNase H-like nuclease (RuvC/YqgF family)
MSLRHAQEEIERLKQQLQAATEVRTEQSQAIKALEGSLAAARIEAAQQNVADSAAAAAAARGEADIKHLKQRVSSLQQEIADHAKEKQALECQVAQAAAERIKSSEELGRAAKAMLLAQVCHVNSVLHADMNISASKGSSYAQGGGMFSRLCSCGAFSCVSALFPSTFVSYSDTCSGALPKTN